MRFCRVNGKPITAGFIFKLLKDSVSDWMEDNALRLSAALAYYAIFSLAPLLLIAVGIAGFFGQNMGESEIQKQMAPMVGAKVAEALAGLVKNASESSKGATIVGAVVLFIGASGVFGQLKDALNTIWEVKQKAGLGIKGFLKERLLSFGMVLVIGFLLLVSLVLSTALAGLNGWLEQTLGMPKFVSASLGFIVSLAVVTLLFGMIFRVLPDAKVEWRSVWIGAAVTALLFEIGKWGLSIWFGSGSATSTFGAAGSIPLLMLWVYYTSCILFFGAEFTQVYAAAMGHSIEPADNAECVTEEARAQQGLEPSKRQEPPQPAPPQVITVPVYQPAPAPVFPSSVAEVPAYFRDSPAASMLAALAGGFAVGLISRSFEGRSRKLSAGEKIAHGSKEIASGSKALSLAAAAVSTKVGRQLLREVSHQLVPFFRKVSRSVKPVARDVSDAVQPIVRDGTRQVRRWFSVGLLFAAVSGIAAEKKDAGASEAQARVQVFLDRANFGPGKIDARDGEFTRKARALYERSVSAGNSAAGDAQNIDTFEPVFTEYVVTAADVASTGEVPAKRPQQAELKWLPYRSVLEAVAEKFHSDVDYLKELNPKLSELKEGDKVTVPNVHPFEVAALKDTKPAAPSQGEGGTGADSKKTAGEAQAQPSVRVSIAEKMLEVRDGKRVVAAFPITPGSDRIPSPPGSWKVKGVARLPDFRYDEKLLKEGKRGEDSVLIPPGPNNPVGVVWIALNRDGIGIHGTDEPDTIGRSASHGCIRLANWDAARLIGWVKSGVAVTIE